jgi:hypothetical protein
LRTGNSGATGTVQSAVFQATAQNGAPGATFLWEFVSNLDGFVFVNPTSSSSQRVSKTAIFNGAQYTCTFRCKITDGQGNVSYTPTCTMTAQFDTFA